MCRKYLFTLLVFLVLLVANAGFAGTHEAIQLAQNRIVSLIEAGDFAAANVAIEQMKTDFAGNKDLADSLLHFAWRSEQLGQRDLARELYQDISQNYSEVDLDRAAFANMWISRFDIYNLVDTGDYAAV